jgi:transcriptional regulator with XRE-family HTH domain
VALPVDTQKFRFRDNGAKIRQARKLTGLSQENFAPLIGTGRRHMIKLENGEHRPSGELRDRIVEVTGTTEQIESSDDEEEDMLLELINSMIQMRAKRLATGDPGAVLR